MLMERAWYFINIGMVFLEDIKVNKPKCLIYGLSESIHLGHLVLIVTHEAISFCFSNPISVNF